MAVDSGREKDKRVFVGNNGYNKTQNLKMLLAYFVIHRMKIWSKVTLHKLLKPIRKSINILNFNANVSL